jgi:hypothetical protein
MRARLAALILVCSTAGCVRVPLPPAALAAPAFSVHPVTPAALPSPLGLEVTSGLVQGLIPATWEAAPLPSARFPSQGFVASPRLRDWERGQGTVGGTEAFWVDEGMAQIPSDYFYLVARGPAIGWLATNKACQLQRRKVYLDDRPDFTGLTDSAGDYVTSGSGVCGSAGKLVRWEYVVVAPGYGPIRSVGIPTSGLYVVIAAVSGSGAVKLLRAIIAATRFHDTPISRFVDAARLLKQ